MTNDRKEGLIGIGRRNQRTYNNIYYIAHDICGRITHPDPRALIAQISEAVARRCNDSEAWVAFYGNPDNPDGLTIGRGYGDHALKKILRFPVIADEMWAAVREINEADDV